MWKKWFRNNIFNSISLIIGLSGIILSIYFYASTIDKKEPFCIIDPSKTTIIDSSQVNNTPLQVNRLDGSQIKGNIFSSFIYFWNDGNKSIRSNDILQPILITLDDKNGEILDYKIIKKSRSVIQPDIIRNPSDSTKSLILNFAILEHLDGFKIQIIYSGSLESRFNIAGTIEGVGKIYTNNSLVQKQFWKIYAEKILIFFGFVLFSLLIVGIIGGLGSLIDIDQKASTRLRVIISKLASALLILFIIFAIIIFIFGLIVNPIKETKKEAQKDVRRIIPECIK
ncbi:MAG: hypothetical protein HQ510_11295 [Candidatus Marinimicrobia bacterium]|nr:hypothetical protein [Candidatus Neomarinimicrobiota bacterium]